METALSRDMAIPFFDGEPLGAWCTQDFNQLCLWAADIGGVSDIMLYSGHAVMIRCDGKWMRATKQAVSIGSILPILDDISLSATSSAMLASGKAIDFVHVFRHARGEQRRYRVNAMACRDYKGGNRGANIVLRIIPDVPPSLTDLNIEKEIVEQCCPHNGMVLVTGTMGNGKSTLMGAVCRHRLEHEPCYIATYEDPIEFNLLDIPNAIGVCTQTEIGQHLESFAEAPRTASRRAVDILYVGESRDTATLMGVLNSADMGMAVYTTVHSRTVAQTPQRIINVFPQTERDNVASTLINNLHLVIQQRLLPAAGKGRVAIREYLHFTEDHKAVLRRLPHEKYLEAIQEMVAADGVTLEQAAREKLEQGEITEDTYQLIRLEMAMKAA